MRSTERAVPADDDVIGSGASSTAADQSRSKPTLDHHGSETFSDPVVRTLTIVLVAVVLLFLSTIVAALVLGVLGSDTPRTVRERDLTMGKHGVDSGSTDPMIWKQYIAALVDSGRLTEAQQVVDRGMQVLDNRPGQDMTFAQVQVHYSSGRYEDAVTAATEGMQALVDYHAVQKNTDGTPEAKGQPISENYWGMLYLRAISYREMGRLEEALADLDEYLAEKSGASNVFVVRGDILADLGNYDAAEADYRKALVHIPDYQPAIDALEKLGVQL